LNKLSIKEQRLADSLRCDAMSRASQAARLAAQDDAALDIRRAAAGWQVRAEALLLTRRVIDLIEFNCTAAFIGKVRNFDNQQRKDVKTKQHWCPRKQDHPKIALDRV
jgi:hypothetical protein